MTKRRQKFHGTKLAQSGTKSDPHERDLFTWTSGDSRGLVDPAGGASLTVSRY
jgi:hypothetical protein